MYNIGICDDGEAVCSLMEDFLLVWQESRREKLNINIWNSGESLCGYLKQDKTLDILFLDIELVCLSGIEAGAFIRNELENRTVQIVYISAKASYAGQLFKTQPLDFMIKPIEQRQIDEVMDLAVKIIGRSNKVLEFQNGRNFYKISYGDIVFLCSEGRKIKVVTFEKIYEFYGKLGEIEKEIPDNFIPIHKSYIINCNYVKCYGYEKVEMENGMSLNISQSNRVQVREKILYQMKEEG